ncbi:MAG TPA: DDE-type integrase/transposase/recombinase, partial [Chloroflexota bacterium]|nr:DDE-type integrase/transposase/recombinase [Chloroflexota bacterium]
MPESAGAGTTSVACRAIDGHGQIVDAYVSPTRDLAAAHTFFEREIAFSGTTPRPVITDKAAT